MNPALALEAQIRSAFASVPRPGPGSLTPHQCAECDELRDSLAPFEAHEVPVAVLQKHVWDLPLLSAQAKHYYLQAWLLTAISTDDMNLLEAARQDINANQRFDPPGGYTDEQWQAIVACLDYFAGSPGQ